MASYLERLRPQLLGPRRLRRDLLREIADHLEDATEAYRRAGYDDLEAGALAVADFGTVEEVVPHLRTTLAMAASRRTSLMLLLALGPQAFLWDAGLGLGGGAHREAATGAVYRALDIAIECGGALCLLGALIAVLATGVGNRWSAAGRGIARSTAWLGLAAATLIPGTGVAMLLLSGGGTLAFWALVVMLMGLPMLGVATLARRTLETC
ncbi:permease prefix domain 1-containing protein [Nocardioides sp. SYSU DS0651]|uniref:permease prefix domain 1-containing protein n=1 Tax=Nocardioides sp. SYSU DS0651 TaxID=3415955 RepID=UPI003F4BB7D1